MYWTSTIKKNIPATIFDQKDPGSMASYGNAGHFSPYAILQLNRPDVLYDIPKMLFSSYGPLALKWNYVPKMIPWFLGYLKNCNKKSMMHTAKYMHQILNLSLDAYDEIFQEFDISNLVEKKGIIYVWTNKNMKSRELEIKVRNDFGVKQKLLTTREILDLEPNLKPVFDGGAYYDYAYHAKDPGGIVKKIFELFIERGGKFIKENVQKVEQSTNNETIIKTENNDYKFEKSVIACGAFSKKFTDQLDEKIPLDTERGYHVHFKGMENLIKKTSYFFRSRIWFNPDESRFKSCRNGRTWRIKKSSFKKRIDYIVKCAKELLPQLKEHEDEWLGFRPTLPDFLPVIGPSKNNKNIVYAFGHQHLGWTLGAITGKVVSGILANEKTNLDLSPYSSSRFN